MVVQRMNSYERLAKVLDTIPNGFPPAADGTHLKVLEWIFTPEEAELASQLKLRGETLEELADRLKVPNDSLKEQLSVMISKGQINSWVSQSTGSRKYALLPFAVGIFEEQLNRMDAEFAHRIEEYFKYGFGQVTATEPVLFKVIPVNQSLNSELEIHPYERAEYLLETASSWGVRECICKRQKELIGEPCRYPTTVCLVFAKNTKNAFDQDELTKIITKEEALNLLKDAEKAGLVHCSFNTKTSHNYICNCCTCCCGVLRGMNTLEKPREFVKTDFIISINVELCSGCGTCIDRCQFAALSLSEDVSVVDEQRCIGCGVCAISCPEGALELIRKQNPEKPEPPENLLDWMTQRAINRGVDPSELL